MILRFFSILLLFYLLGFIVFSVTLERPAPADAPRADAVVVLTGGTGRIDYAMNALAGGGGKRLLIAGADPAVTKADIIDRFDASPRLVNCCVDLGSESVDTRSNAEETKRWLDRHGFNSLRLVTNNWHMRRARYEFRRVLGDQYQVIFDAVPTDPPFMTLFGEYNDYLLRRVAVLLEI